MVSLETRIRNVGTFNGDLSVSRRDYLRTGVYIPKIEELMGQFERALKLRTGYTVDNPPVKKAEDRFVVGDVDFKVASHKRTKKPSYKDIVNGMESHLNGILFLVSTGRTITGIANEKEEQYISLDKLKEDFDVIVGGAMYPDIKQTITYSVSGSLERERSLTRLVAPKRIFSLKPTTSQLYVRLDRIFRDMIAFRGSYEGEVNKKGVKTDKKTKTTQVSSTQAFKMVKIKREGPNWTNVVKTLVQVPIKKSEEGELDELQKMNVRKARKLFPHYRFVERPFRGNNKLYISIPSMLDYIVDLKAGELVKAVVTDIQAREVL